MLTNLPKRPRSLNSTTPVTFAKSVSSLPQPTFRPGLILVPRCRTIIDPPGTSCPPNTFTPSRCAFESRPFLELPKPFLCAIRHLSHDLADLHLSEGLAVPDGFLVLLLALELEHQNLGAPTVGDNRRLDQATRHELAALIGECGLHGQFDFRADVAVDFFHAEHVSGSNPVLLSAGLNNRVHAMPLIFWNPGTRGVSGTGVNRQFTTDCG